MPPAKLKVIAGQTKREFAPRVASSYHVKKQSSKTHWDLLWTLNPERFNPARNEIERQRIMHTWELLTSQMTVENRKIADLGCGYGVLARKLKSSGAYVTAVDLSTEALKHMKEEEGPHLTLVEDCLPRTQFADESFEAVICTDVIAELDPLDYRLFFSEMARILKKEGMFVCSTPMDYRTKEAALRFLKLIGTEFTIIETIVSHHALVLRIIRFLRLPETYWQCAQRQEFYREELSKRRGLSKKIFRICCRQDLKPFWQVINGLFRPLYRYFENSQKWIGMLEKATRMLYGTSGISHVICAGVRRHL